MVLVNVLEYAISAPLTHSTEVERCGTGWEKGDFSGKIGSRLLDSSPRIQTKIGATRVTHLNQRAEFSEGGHSLLGAPSFSCPVPERALEQKLFTDFFESSTAMGSSHPRWFAWVVPEWFEGKMEISQGSGIYWILRPA